MIKLDGRIVLMNVVKTKFSIKDLESLGGVKAHTIRIWEKRYNLLNPDRTPTNIRTYSLQDLQKLLNVTFLLDHEYKISKVAKHSTHEIEQLVSNLIDEQQDINNHHAINSLKMAMMNFDQSLFHKTYSSLKSDLDFRTIFTQVFIPLLEQIGLLWQTNTIDPAHEHFVANLIKQKILIEIENCQQNIYPKSSKTFVLFLPENEIHDLGLMFLNYEINAAGHSSIYLGQSIQLESLRYLAENQKNVHFISYFTVKPEEESLSHYVNRFNKELNAAHIPFYLFGRKAYKARPNDFPENAKIFKSIAQFSQIL